MVDAEGAELLAPCTNSVRCGYPFHGGPHDSSSNLSDRLAVVYDRHFDQFFLREQPTSVAPLPSVKNKAQKTLGAVVQWEDVLLPPRSVSKRVDPIVSQSPSEWSATDDQPTNIASIQQPDRDDTITSDTVPEWNASQQPTDAAAMTATEPVEPSTLSAPDSTETTQGLQLVPNPDRTRCDTPPAEPSTPSATESTAIAQDLHPAPNTHSRLPENPATECHQAASPSPFSDQCGLVQPQQRKSKLELAIILLRSLRRFLRRRQLLESPALLQVPLTDTTPAAAAVTEPVSPTPTLQLDFSKLKSPPTASTSPRHKSPKKRTRPAALIQPSAKEAAHRESSSPYHHIQNQDEHEIRWQGQVIHVSVVPVETTNQRQPPPIHLPQRSPQTLRLPTLSHIYNVRELARIRPTPDGFRRVNGHCTFTALTSSSSSSSSEEEEEEDNQSSSEGDDVGQYWEFSAGDSVLFTARHRWFKGRVLKRIRRSCFYDIRAANGSVFEAIPARRMRVFDGDDDRPEEYEFKLSDRVLWKRQDADNNERRQTYKARITLIRRPVDSRDRNRYDLELLTGRIVKRVPRRELRPLRR